MIEQEEFYPCPRCVDAVVTEPGQLCNYCEEEVGKEKMCPECGSDKDEREKVCGSCRNIESENPAKEFYNGATI